MTMAGTPKRTAILRRMINAAKTNSHRVHVIWRGKNWAVKLEGNHKASTVHDSENDAIAAAEELVRSGKASFMVVHTSDGKIRR